MNQKTKRPLISDDQVSAYAKQVVAGKIVSGPHVRDACQRHLNDLETAASRGFFFDLDAVNDVIGFFKVVLRLNGQGFEGQPYQLLPWQAFIVGSLFGWKLIETGMRRFTTAYIETAKGSGKSPLAAGVGLYMMVGNKVRIPRAEIYAAASKKDQAMILFRDAVAMVDQSPELAKVLSKSGIGERTYNLAFLKMGSWFRPISSDDGQSGPRPYVVLMDEVHEHKMPTVVDMARAGLAKTKNGMMVMITNSGANKTSVCGSYHDFAVQVCAGTAKKSERPDSFFAYVCALDKADNPFKNEKCWHKANPSLKYGIPNIEGLRQQVGEAKGMPSKEATVRRLHFCEWTNAYNPWISQNAWMACNQEAEFDESLLFKRRCWGGLDLSSTQDLTAFVLLFEPTAADPFWRLKPYFWLPKDGLLEKEDKDRVPYLAWRAQGFLNATTGRAINKLEVLQKIDELADLYEIDSIAYDRWGFETFQSFIDTQGITLPALLPFGQGYKDMAPAVNELERLIVDNKIKHDSNPVMNWCAANAVLDTDPAGNRKITKARATARVDGIVAAIMAAGIAVGKQETTKITQGFVVLD